MQKYHWTMLSVLVYVPFVLLKHLIYRPTAKRDLHVAWRLVHQALTFNFMVSKSLLSLNTFLVNVSFLSAQALQIMATPSISLLKKSPTNNWIF